MQKDFEIIKNIAQAASNITYDGATDENYEPHKIGLSREEGHPVLDSRNIDGFKIRLAGNHMIVSYSIEQKLSDVYAQKLEQEMEQVINQCVSYLKTEYRKISGQNLRLAKEGDVNVNVSYISRVRTCIYATCTYRVASLKEVDQNSQPSEDRLNDTFKKFLSMGRDDATNPMNITRKDT
tara:strand:+ start:201 stop:740 length:540 start_codon:yes stop_codon:yes gene_type:complete